MLVIELAAIAENCSSRLYERFELKMDRLKNIFFLLREIGKFWQLLLVTLASNCYQLSIVNT